MDANELEGRYLGEAVVVFVGSEDEKLGEDGKLTGEGANPAKVTIYGKNHKDESSQNYGKPIKTGIFFHRTNRSGVATDSSTGCPVVDGRQWRNVERQLGKSNNIFIRVSR